MSRRLLWAMLLGTLLLLPSRASADKTVLLINSYYSGYNWVYRYSDAFSKEIGEAATIYTYDLDTKRIHDSLLRERADKALKGLDRLQPDVVVTGDDNALKLLGKGITDRGYPLVYLGINNNPRAYGIETDKATGVLERPCSNAPSSS